MTRRRDIDPPVTYASVPSSRLQDLAGAACGLAAGTVALAAAQVGGKLVPGARPPLQVLGDLVIRVTPVSVTEALIRQVGHSDKLVLLVCILTVAALAAATVGVRFSRGHAVGALAGIGLLTVLPALAAYGEAGSSVVRELVVLVPGAVLGAAVLWALGRPLLDRAAAVPRSRAAERPGKAAIEANGHPDKRAASRQQRRARQAAAEHAALVQTACGLQRRTLLRAVFIVTASAAAGTAAVRKLSQPSLALMSRLRASLPAPANPLPELVDEFGAYGSSPLTTPLTKFYRIDTALSPPQVDPETWTLTLSRDGKALHSYSYDELLARSTSQADITIGCVSNEVGGDLIGTARWQGVLLADLFKEAGVTRAARVAGISVDGFVASFRGEYAFDGRPAMIAVGMNGQPLPVKHGFPARLVVPGLYGYTSATKWLQQIDVSDSTDLPGFWADRGWDPDVKVHVMSRIDSPSDFANLRAGNARLAGVAWAPVAGVGSVEVQVDDGPWQPATLSAAVTGIVWRQWTADWHPTPGTHTVRVRATDATGRPQDTKQRPVFPSGATGLHQVRITVT